MYVLIDCVLMLYNYVHIHRSLNFVLNIFIYLIFTAPDTPEPPRTCTIISSLPAVTTPSGLTAVVASGTQNVTLYCICMTDNIAVGPIRWFFNGTEVTRKNKAGNPYSRNNLPSPLIIPLFVFGHDGTYHCKSSPFYPALISKNDSITLTLPGTCNLNYLL